MFRSLEKMEYLKYVLCKVLTMLNRIFFLIKGINILQDIRLNKVITHFGAKSI